MDTWQKKKIFLVTQAIQCGNLKGVRIHDQALVKVLWPMHGTLHAILKSWMYNIDYSYRLVVQCHLCSTVPPVQPLCEHQQLSQHDQGEIQAKICLMCMCT